MTKFLYGKKQCHRCTRRNICNLKNDRKTLLKDAKPFKITNRGINKNAKVPDITIFSFCKYFEPEQEDTEMMERPKAMLTTPFNTIPAEPEARKRIVSEPKNDKHKL